MEKQQQKLAKKEKKSKSNPRAGDDVKQLQLQQKKSLGDGSGDIGDGPSVL